jgi:hypothetical protein
MLVCDYLSDLTHLYQSLGTNYILTDFFCMSVDSSMFAHPIQENMLFGSYYTKNYHHLFMVYDKVMIPHSLMY